MNALQCVRGKPETDELVWGDPNRPGVYEISTPTINEVIYIGSAARSINRRWAIHRYHLRNGKHANHRLQAVAKKYGLSVLVFRVVENCSPLDCLATEQRYIDTCPREKRYNLSPVAGSRLGARLSAEQKRQMAVRRGGIGSTEVLARIVAEYEAGANQADLAKKYGVDRASIRNYLRAMGCSIRTLPTRDAKLQSIVVEKYNAGKTIRLLAQEHGLDYQTVFRILQNCGVQLRSNSRRQRLRFQTIESRRAHSQARGGRIYRFVHRVHGEFVGYPSEFAEKFGLQSRGNIFQVIKGRRLAYRGWELAEVGESHRWKCPEGGRVRKLTAAQVLEVRELLRSGVRQTSIATTFKIDQSSISRIKTGEYRYAI